MKNRKHFSISIGVLSVCELLHWPLTERINLQYSNLTPNTAIAELKPMQGSDPATTIVAVNRDCTAISGFDEKV